MLAILHNIRSLHNVGSIFRTAESLGFKKVYAVGLTPSPRDRFGQLRKQFAKVALGAEKSLPFDESYRHNFSGLIKKLKEDGYQILAVEQSKKSVPYYKYKSHGSRPALILGNEVRGLPASALRASDRILEIPMLGQKESLNVAVAFGIVAAHLKFATSGKRHGERLR